MNEKYDRNTPNLRPHVIIVNYMWNIFYELSVHQKKIVFQESTHDNATPSISFCDIYKN